MAFRSVFRRPKQNIAVLMGITLGVSLIAGVQIGGDSLAEGFIIFGIHSLGEIDVEISTPYYPFYISESIFNESVGLGPPAPIILDELLNSGSHLDYIKKVGDGFAISQRLDLSVSAIDEETGSTEISKPFIGMDPDEVGFGEFTDNSGKNLNVADLKEGEVFLGKETADTLFVERNPIGENITISTSLLSCRRDVYS